MFAASSNQQVGRLLEIATVLRASLGTGYRFASFLEGMRQYGEEARRFGLPTDYLLRMADGFELVARSETALNTHGALGWLRHLEARHLFPPEGRGASEVLLGFQREGDTTHPILRRSLEIRERGGDSELWEAEYKLRLEEEGPAIPDYEGLEWIGEGTVGIVFTGHPVGNPSKRVAIKVYPISGPYGSPLFHCYQSNLDPRLLSAGERSALLVTAIDFGVTLDGDPYIVMPHVQGSSLLEIWEEEGFEGSERMECQISREELFLIGERMIEAVAHLHDEGLVHRDLKPESFLWMGGLSPDVHLLDLDFVTKIGSFPADRAPQLAGTLGYLPPEAFDGATPNPRFDLFALSATLYYLLTGQHPFSVISGSNLPGEVPRERRREEVSTLPLPPQTHNPEISPAMGALILKGLSADPELRWRDARQLWDAFTVTK